MDHPPAPVFHDGDVGPLAIEQARAIEQADGDGGDGQQQQQVVVAALFAQRRHHAAQHQHQPEEQAAEQRDLPHPAGIEIFIALMPQPEAQLGRHLLRDGQVVADERSGHHQQQGPEQDVHPQLLILGVAAMNDRRQEQAGGQEGGGDPQHRALHMPGAGQGIGEPLRDIDAVKALPLDGVVRGEAADEHLEDEQRRHQEQILAQRPL